MNNNVDNKMLYACTVRVCCHRTHTVPQILEMVDQNEVIKDAVIAVNTISKGRYVDLEVINFKLYNQLILQGLPCPSHKVIHKVVPIYTEDKCLITAYNTPTKAVALPELTRIIEEHGYEIVMVHQVDIRPGLKSGIRKYLTKFSTRTPIKLPEMVELYGRKIGFEQTSSSLITEPQQEAHMKEHQDQQEITIESPQEKNAETTTETTIETTTEQEQQPNMDLQELVSQPITTPMEQSYASITKTPITTPKIPSPNNHTISDDIHHHSIFDMSFPRKPSPTKEHYTSQTIPSEQKEQDVIPDGPPSVTPSTHKATPVSKTDRTVAVEPTRSTFEYEGFSYITYKSKPAVKGNDTRFNSAPYKISSQETYDYLRSLFLLICKIYCFNKK